MSGIVGILHKDGRGIDPEDLRRMLRVLSHRGPDSSDVWYKGPVGLGHCMFRTTPESIDERQPMANHSGEIVLTADARIDNREELITTLDIDGPPSIICDSQIILASYEKWGDQCPERLLGDFAFTIWDGRRGILFCARDPMAVNPFFYYSSDQFFAFASEIGGLFSIANIPLHLNDRRIGNFMCNHIEEEEPTFYTDVFRLTAATCMTVGNDLRKRKYWSIHTNTELRLESDAEYADAFRDVFTEAVRCRLRTITPTGCLLSGGLDSSSISCTARRVIRRGRNEPFHTFSAVFPSLPEKERLINDESTFIREVLDLGGFEPHFTRTDLMGPLRDVRSRFLCDDEPYISGGQLFTMVGPVAAAKDSGILTLLAGFAGDTTISFGYEYLPELARRGRILKLWKESRQLAAFARRSVRFILRTFVLQTLVSNKILYAWDYLRGRRSSLPSITRAINPVFAKEQELERKLNQNSDRFSTAQKSHCDQINSPCSLIGNEVYKRLGTRLGVDLRLPFLDRRLLEFCVSVPPSKKLCSGWPRWILRRGMEGILPPRIQWRTTKGDMIPNLRRNLAMIDRPILEEVILEKAILIERYYNIDILRRSLTEFVNDPNKPSLDSIVTLLSAASLGIWLESVQWKKGKSRMT